MRLNSNMYIYCDSTPADVRTVSQQASPCDLKTQDQEHNTGVDCREGGGRGGGGGRGRFVCVSEVVSGNSRDSQNKEGVSMMEGLQQQCTTNMGRSVSKDEVVYRLESL